MRVDFNQNGFSADMEDSHPYMNIKPEKSSVPLFFQLNSQKKCVCFGIVSFILAATAIILSAYMPSLSELLSKDFYTLLLSLSATILISLIFSLISAGISIVCFAKTKERKSAYAGIACAIVSICSILIRFCILLISVLSHFLSNVL